VPDGALAMISWKGFSVRRHVWQTGATWAEDMATLGNDQSADSGAGMVGRQGRPPAGACRLESDKSLGFGDWSPYKASNRLTEPFGKLEGSS
jgi:hypothetical protein